MAVKISPDKWSVETKYGHALFSIHQDGLHVQCVTVDGVKIITHQEKIICFDNLIDKAEGQGRLIP
jgi:hypothetical protein